MPPRFHVDLPLTAGLPITLPPGPSRHAQVLRLQPGDEITLFDGRGGEWPAEITHMGRKEVDARVGEHRMVDPELRVPVCLALGMPANERMDDLVEKATELGVARIQPLMCERSVLRLSGERAEKKRDHWQAVATSACEQSGRTRVPVIEPVMALPAWLRGLGDQAGLRVLMSTHEAPPFPGPQPEGLITLSGPEGGLSPAEEQLALKAGFSPASLGPRILRADTAPLAALALWSLLAR